MTGRYSEQEYTFSEKLTDYPIFLKTKYTTTTKIIKERAAASLSNM
jgi:hypothetical protein